MDYHRFAVTNFEIGNTRSIHEDTLHLSHSVHVDDDNVVSNVVKLGDSNNGSYQTENFTFAANAGGAGCTQVSVH